MRSMTGFGTATLVDGGLRARCEVRSVNHKGLDVKFRLPRSVAHLELALLGVVKEQVERGRVDVWIEVESGPGSGTSRFDAARARTWIDAVVAYANTDPRISPALTAADVLRLPGVIVDEDESIHVAWEPTLRAVVRTALAGLRESREREGRGLREELLRLTRACRLLEAGIAARAAAAPAEIHQRLRSRLDALTSSPALDPTRVAQEAALLAERADVGEELARLRLHLDHFDDLLALDVPVGRKLDFLCQELLRETNTIGSKCQDAPVAHAIVELKAEIERLREQVQNVE